MNTKISELFSILSLVAISDIFQDEFVQKMDENYG